MLRALKILILAKFKEYLFQLINLDEFTTFKNVPILILNNFYQPKISIFEKTHVIQNLFGLVKPIIKSAWKGKTKKS